MDRGPGGDLGQLLDPELIAAARDLEPGASDELFRRHWGAGVTIAVRLVGPSDAEDLVSDAFVKIFDLIGRGKGPTYAFRPYLATTLRTLHVDGLRRGKDILVEDFARERFEPTAGDGTDQRAEADIMARAFARLPERWQLTLWHTAVDDESHSEVGRRLGITPNSVAALSFRAREGLRRAYLAEHLAATEQATCRSVLEQLPRFARRDLTDRQMTGVRQHLADCDSCGTAARELEEINSALGGLLLPAIAGVVLVKQGAGLVGGATAAAHGPLALKVGVAVVVSALAVGSALLLVPDDAISAPDDPAARPVASAPPSPPAPEVVAASPAVTPSPDAVPVPAPAVEPPEPLALGDATAEVLTRTPIAWTHVDIPILGRAGQEPLELVIELENVGQSVVHRDGAYSAWKCEGLGSAVLTCTLPVGAEVGISLGLDVTAARPGPMRVSAALTPRDGAGREAAGSRTSVRVPAAT